MKNLLGILLILVSASAAQARSPRKVVMELSLTPIHIQLGRDMEYVMVYTDGEVQGVTCPAIGAVTECPRTHLDSLTGKEIEKIEKKIQKASKFEAVDPNPGGIRCRAIPITKYRYSAGNVTLAAGSTPCGGSKVNPSKEAKELVKMLNDYKQEYDRLRHQ